MSPRAKLVLSTVVAVASDGLRRRRAAVAVEPAAGAAGAPSPSTFPPYELKTLPNGLQVVVVPHHEQPAVSFRLLIRAGASRSRRTSPASRTSRPALLDQGTTTRSADQMADLIESAGGIVGVGSGNDLSFINGVVMKDRSTSMLALASDMAQNPAFAQDEIERQRSRPCRRST